MDAPLIEGVTVAGDLLRPDGDCRPGGKDRATIWLWNAVGHAVNLACGLPPNVLTTASDPRLRPWIHSLRPLERADAYWASVFDDVPVSPAFEELVVARLRGRFCIGFEMPPWLVRLLDGLALPYIDLCIHPVRFLDDLIFAVRASCPETRAALLEFAVPAARAAVMAGSVEAMSRVTPSVGLPDGTLLIAGQRRYDATQIVDGAFFDAMPLRDQVHALCANYRALILKPHPTDRSHSLLTVAAAAPVPVLGVTDDNIYRLMALPQISAVLTVNSSVAHEAPFFGKRVHTLAPLPIRPVWFGAPAEAGVHVSLGDIVLTPDFWRMVLAPHLPVTALDGMRLPPKPNRIRIAFDSFWNHQQIDTDRIPRSGMA